MIECALFQHRAPFREIGDGKLRQLNINEWYELGKKTARLEDRLSKIETNVALSSVALHLFTYRWDLQAILREPCALLTASQRAARAIIKVLDDYITNDVNELFDPKDPSATIQPYQLGYVTQAISKFETILTNDMPEMSTFAVSQIGIFRTDDLIHGAYRQIAEPLRELLHDKAREDIISAGKCLAFRVSTASAFHACRAIEAGIDQYIEALTEKPYAVSPSGGNNNWGAKIEALGKAGADEKVTEFLTHIRKQYRNPVTHPEVVVDEYEAVDLFVASLSAISMMLGAVKAIAEKKEIERSWLAALGDSYETATGSSAGELQPNDEENSLGIEAGVTTENGSGEAV